jgi:hypothetical protein
MALVAIKNISPKQFEQGLLTSLIIFSIIFLLNKLQIVNINPSVLNDNFISQRYGHSYLADLLILIFPFLISKINSNFNKKQKYLNFSYLIFFLIILILTNSRSGITALSIGLLFLKTKNSHQKTIKRIILGLISIVLVLFLTPRYQNEFNKTISGQRFQYWNIALQSFQQAPLFGNGPNTFPLIRKQIQKQATNSNLTHSSLLNFLCENGIFFTFIFFFSIFYGLNNTKKKNNIFFTTSIIVITHSLLDPTWNSPGIFIISLYLIFYYSPIFNLKKQKNRSTIPILILATICLLFYSLDTISNQLFIKDKYQSSLIFNPLNLDSRLKIISTTKPDSALWQNNLNFTLKFFPKNEIVYQKLINTLPFNQSEKYYYQLFQLNPKENFNYYYQITNIYYQNQNYEKLDKIIDLIDTNFIENQFLANYAIPLSKITYEYALQKYSSINPQKSLKYFQFTKKIFPILGYYQIEYANSLWHLGQKQQAKEVLNDCLKYPHPKQQCLTYLEEHQNIDFNQPGEPEFRNYIQNKLKISPN